MAHSANRLPGPDNMGPRPPRQRGRSTRHHWISLCCRYTGLIDRFADSRNHPLAHVREWCTIHQRIVHPYKQSCGDYGSDMSEAQNIGPQGPMIRPSLRARTMELTHKKFSHSPVAARVPEKIGRGVFSTGVLVQDGPGEFVVDFLQGLARPPSIVARVVLSPVAMISFVNSLKENLGNFNKNFGAPTPLPKPPTQNRPTIQELYDHFKLPEDLMSGVYSNSFLIAHGPSEFCFDFITGFFPTAAVSCRAYLSAQQIPRLLDTLVTSMQQHQQRFGGGGPIPPQQSMAPQPPPPVEPHG